MHNKMNFQIFGPLGRPLFQGDSGPTRGEAARGERGWVAEIPRSVQDAVLFIWHRLTLQRLRDLRGTFKTCSLAWISYVVSVHDFSPAWRTVDWLILIVLKCLSTAGRAVPTE